MKIKHYQHCKKCLFASIKHIFVFLELSIEQFFSSCYDTNLFFPFLWISNKNCQASLVDVKKKMTNQSHGTGTFHHFSAFENGEVCETEVDFMPYYYSILSEHK